MHQVNWACVCVDIRLDRCLLGLILVAAAATVKSAEEETEAKVHQSLQDGEEGIEPHQAADSVADAAEPHLVEV